MSHLQDSLALDLTPKKRGSEPQIDNANVSNKAVNVQCSPEQPMSTSNEEGLTRFGRPFTSKFDTPAYLDKEITKSLELPLQTSIATQRTV